MIIFINPGRAVFARERCDNFVWRASQYFQNMLQSVSRLKHLVSPSHSNQCIPNSLSEDSRKHIYQVHLDGYILKDGGTIQRVFQVSPNL